MVCHPELVEGLNARSVALLMVRQAHHDRGECRSEYCINHKIYIFALNA